MKMIRLFLLLFLALNIGAIQTTNAQDGEKKESEKDAKKRMKEEKKRQKEELKQYKKMKPEAVKAMKVGNDRLNSQVSTLSYTRDSQTQVINTLQAKISEQDSALKTMEANMAANKAQASVSSDDAGSMGGSGSTISTTKGIVFAVQLGAFRNFNLSKSPGKGVNVQTEEGISKYIVGIFRKPTDADVFKKEIQKMGIKDAWVVAFKDGKRIPKEEAIKLMKSGSGGGNGVEVSE